jgi:hypothetical protein
MKEFKFNNIYELISLIDRVTGAQEDFWNFDVDYFISASTTFSKDALLHQYIVTTAFNYYRRDFRKNGDCIEEDGAAYWMSLFDTYGVKIDPLHVERGEDPYDWLNMNESQFIQLFDEMAYEAFHILFLNRNFLLKFNRLVAETVPEVDYPDGALTEKGTIKRKAIPQWVRNAVYHRDKGRCVYCNTDLIGIVNLLTEKNFDHMVPLDLFGANDPCNIQLSCETCNKSKSNRNSSTSSKYQPWWP